MTKFEAIAAMQNGQKVTHSTYFSNNEWVTIEGGKMLFEDGVRCSQTDFWRDRQAKGFETDWEIFQDSSTPPSPLDEEGKKELYFLIDLSSQTRKEFFESEFGFYDSEGETTKIKGIEYSIDRIEVNGEQFLVKGCEIVICTPAPIHHLDNNGKDRFRDNLKAIVEQLEFCEYQTKDTYHELKYSAAFIALKEMALRLPVSQTVESQAVTVERIMNAVSKSLQWRDGEITGITMDTLEQKITGILTR